VFPFLIGTVRTQHFQPHSQHCKHVSIPHRYGKNFRLILYVFLYIFQFPFLIGTVRTNLYFFTLRGRLLFPFLIGTVRTNTPTISIHTTRKFPFLIGTVRTHSPCNQALNHNRVSIPHRYGKNLSTIFHNVPNSRVSIPHRYGKNAVWLSVILSKSAFPFLIGTVRTLSTFQPYTRPFGVSIPHRYGKNFVNLSTLHAAFWSFHSS